MRSIAIAVLLMLGATASLAHDYRAGTLEIGHPASRPSTGRTGVAYFAVTNKGDAPDRLTGIKVGGGFADRAEMHATMQDGDVMRMRPVQVIDVPPGQTVTLAPGGLHVMLLGLKAPLKAGDEMPLTLVFERAGAVDIKVMVEKAGATPGTHKGH